MQTRTLTLLAGALLLIAGGGLVLPDLMSDTDVPTVRWDAGDEVEVPAEAAVPASTDGTTIDTERSAVELTENAGGDERIEVLLRGRVVDRFTAPIAEATVWLDFGRGGMRGGPAERNRRVPDPVRTDAEGRFAFQGQTFRNLRVSLQVAHTRYAVGQFDKDVGRVAAEVDLGDLVLLAGGEARGRVTDLDGNGVPGASLRLQPENENTMRWLRDRERLLPPFTTDQNGYYRQPHLPAGSWSLNATAKRHTEGRSTTFVVEDERVVDVDDIRLGPGYELSGTVRSLRGDPIAKARVALQSEARGRGGRNAPGREHRATTDEQGRFFVEHLPGAPLRVETEADGYLDHRLDSVDPTLGQALDVTLQDGLRIEGRVTEPDGAAVTLFAFRAVYVRGLPQPGQAAATERTMADLMARMREGNVDEQTRRELRTQMESLRADADAMTRNFGERIERARNRGPGGPGLPESARAERAERGAGRARDMDKPEQHADGVFVATGLQEGVYEVLVQSPDHARYRSAEIELRSGVAVAPVDVVLDGGVFVAGVVVDSDGAPVRNARVELRTPPPTEGAGGNRRNGGGSPGGDNSLGFANAFANAMRFGANAQQLDTTTDADGAFVIKHVPRGTWRVHADARGYANATTDPFELTADRSGVELRLGKLGSITGSVAGLRPEELAEARVGAVAPNGGFGAMFGRNRGGGGGPFANVSVAADGTYVIDELVPGEYVVRAWIGSPQALMRELGPSFGAGTLQPDAIVNAGEATKLDVTVTRPQIGTVAGTVMQNGTPPTGWVVNLSPQNEGARNGGPGERGRMQFMWGNHSSGVAASGRFTIANVPAGTYVLRVRSAAGGNSDSLHEEIVQVTADSTLERTIAVTTYSLRGSVTRDDGGKSEELAGNVRLFAGVTEMPENLGAFSREQQPIRTAVRNGTFTFDSLKPGSYLLVLAIRGREQTNMQIVVTGDQAVTIAAGAASESAPAGGNGGAPLPGTPR